MELIRQQFISWGRVLTFLFPSLNFHVMHDICKKTEKTVAVQSEPTMNFRDGITSLKIIWIAVLCLTCSVIGGIAYAFGFNKENTFDLLRDKNNLTDIETFGLLFGQQLCSMIAFTVLEIREDLILSPKENMLRGIGTHWPRSRVYRTIYIQMPINLAAAFALFMYFDAPLRLFSTYEDETWILYSIKMVLWFIVWEFIMYWFHRLAHAVPWIYKIAHKDHHVEMDFPLGPHAPFLEHLTTYVATIAASQIVGVSVGSWVFAINLLMMQCVLEHAYSSFEIPIFHDLFCFNTADLHQAHHVCNNGNFGYALNIFDPLFGTLLEREAGKRRPIAVTGPATPARHRLLWSRRFKKVFNLTK